MDTGAAFLPVPQVDGLDPMENSSTPPLASSACGSDVDVQGRPSKVTPWT